MRRLLFGAARCGDMPVRYYLLAGTLNQEIEEYGLAVEMGEEETVLPALTISQRRIQDLLNLLMRGGVTPVAVRDVAEDWLLA